MGVLRIRVYKCFERVLRDGFGGGFERVVGVGAAEFLAGGRSGDGDGGGGSAVVVGKGEWGGGERVLWGGKR